MIKNIVFDIGNIILEGKPKSALKNVNLDEAKKKIIEEVVFENPNWIELDLGIVDYNSYFEKVKKDIPEDIQNVAKEVLTRLDKYRDFNEDILNLIRKLSNNYKIYILSDNNVAAYNYLKTTELNNYVNGWCISAMYHEVKKGKKLFKILFETYQLNPNECYFIDDKIENIQIGKDLGMTGFALDWQENHFDDLIKDMTQNNIKI